MKKIGQKLSFLTKIMLVIGLLVSNLSSLSVVFAYEAAPDVLINLNEENVLDISYNEKLAEEVEAVDLKIYEYYTFLDGSTKKVNEDVYSLNADELLAAKDGELEVSYDSIFAIDEDVLGDYKVFDGTYNVKVEIMDVSDYSEDVPETEIEEIIPEETLGDSSEVIDGDEESELLLPLAEGTYEKEIRHESGLGVKVYDSQEITEVSGKYPVNSTEPKIKVIAQVLSGGLSPSDEYVIKTDEGEKQLSARSLLEYPFIAEKDFAGYMYGEYELPVAVKVLKKLVETENLEVALTEDTSVSEGENLETPEEFEQYEEIQYTYNISIMYESYKENTNLLNELAEMNGYIDSYIFYGEEKDGTLIYLSDLEENDVQVASEESENVVTKTMLDLYNLAEAAVGDSETISYQLLKAGVDVMSGYEAVAETQTVEEYLRTILVDDTVTLVFANDGLTITYDVVILADLNNDGEISDADLLELIDQVVLDKETEDLEKSDIYKDGTLDTLDVLYLSEVIKTKEWLVLFGEEEAKLDANLFVTTESNEELVSGDEFTVDYVLSIIEGDVTSYSGTLEYNKEALELISIEEVNGWSGKYGAESGKFIYFGDEALVGPEIDEIVEDDNLTDTEEENDTVVLTEEAEQPEDLEEEVVTEDYVLLTAKFRALKAGTHAISVKDNKYYNGVNYLVLEEELDASVEVSVVASEDNSLSYLEIAGQEIALEEGIYEYEITVANEVTLVDLKYILSNVAAKVTSTIYPEELVEGTNSVVITVVSESGESQDYTITVIREEAEEVTTQVSYDNYYNNYEENTGDGEIVVTPGDLEEEEEEPKKEESNLSRIVIIILILIVIAGLVYLIFKDDDEETKKANKAVNKLKKESLDEDSEVSKKVVNKETNKKESSKHNASHSNSKASAKVKNKGTKK